jgi:DNA polymerase delta subunit 3
MADADEEIQREPTPEEQAPPPPSKPAELKEEVTVQGGRRRGKRQVMKKRTVKDAEGYLGKSRSLTYIVEATILMHVFSDSRRSNLGVIL